MDTGICIYMTPPLTLQLWLLLFKPSSGATDPSVRMSCLKYSRNVCKLHSRTYLPTYGWHVTVVSDHKVTCCHPKETYVECPATCNLCIWSYTSRDTTLTWSGNLARLCISQTGFLELYHLSLLLIPHLVSHLQLHIMQSTSWNPTLCLRTGRPEVTFWWRDDSWTPENYHHQGLA